MFDTGRALASSSSLPTLAPAVLHHILGVGRRCTRTYRDVPVHRLRQRRSRAARIHAWSGRVPAARRRIAGRATAAAPQRHADGRPSGQPRISHRRHTDRKVPLWTWYRPLAVPVGDMLVHGLVKRKRREPGHGPARMEDGGYISAPDCSARLSMADRSVMDSANLSTVCFPAVAGVDSGLWLCRDEVDPASVDGP